MKPTLGIDNLKPYICYINEFAQELLENISTKLGVNVITLEPLLAGNK